MYQISFATQPEGAIGGEGVFQPQIHMRPPNALQMRSVVILILFIRKI